MPSLLLSMAAAIIVTAVIFGSVGLADRAGTSRAQQTNSAGSRLEPATPLGTSASPATPLGTSASPSAPSAPSAARSRPTVELRWTHGESWARVTDHKGVVLLNDIFPKGTVKKFTGPSFYLEMGNAGAITLVDKGKAMIAGKQGQTARCTVTGP